MSDLNRAWLTWIAWRPHKGSEAGRELCGAWHPRLAHQYGNHPHASCQGRFDLQPHEVARIVQTPAILISGREPAVTDYR
jgi:hypothetical protein